MGRATNIWAAAGTTSTYFNPRPPRGGRLRIGQPQHRGCLFQSTPSARRATLPGHKSNTLRIFQSTPSARRATSVHRCSISGHIYFNPRPPRGGRPIQNSPQRILYFNFNPRPPRGGRPLRPNVLKWSCRISIHALREEGDPGLGDEYYQKHKISIHALREEGDRARKGMGGQAEYFNPRPPRGGRRKQSCRVCTTTSNFNPRPPRGGRQYLGGGRYHVNIFQSTPSARRATRDGCIVVSIVPISIHALREEGDRI